MIWFFCLFSKLTAVVILTLGLWIRYDWDFKHYILELRLYQFWTGVYILIAAASIVMAISFLGCCGTIMENPTVLGLVRTKRNIKNYNFKIMYHYFHRFPLFKNLFDIWLFSSMVYYSLYASSWKLLGLPTFWVMEHCGPMSLGGFVIDFMS